MTNGFAEPIPAALDEGLTRGPNASAARALPAGARLDEFEIEEVIGEGSVGIVYAATDRALAVPVAIAEYIPARLAERDDEAQVGPRTSAQTVAFAKGLKAFIEDTHALTRCDHPSLVRIVRLCEANSTAYRVMPRYPSRRLLEVRQGMKAPPDDEALRALLDALLGALQMFHHEGCHGKVTPSNILLLAGNRPLLLCPGAASRAIAADGIDALTTSVEPCFAPIEQIVEPDTPLHPSADLYALANVARYWISGDLPPPAFGVHAEKLADTVQRLRLTWPRLHYSASLLDALDSALSIYPAERPQSVAEMRARLDTAPSTAGHTVSAAWAAAPVLKEAAPASPAPPSRPAAPASVGQDLNAMALASDPVPLTTFEVAHIDDDPSVRMAFKHQGAKPRRIAMWGGGVLVLLVLLPVGMLVFHQERQVARVLDVAGISGGTGAESAAVPSSAVGTAAPVTPPIAADAGAASSMLTKPTTAAADPPARPAATPPAIAQRPAPAPPTRVAQQPVSRAPASPREVCGARTQFALYRCMQAQCSQPQWASHAQCERLRTTDSVD